VTFSLETIGIADQYVRRGLDNLAQAFPVAPPNALGAIPTTSATLPTGTYNGQDFYYQLGSGGGVWHFKYNTSSAKWDFAGGAALYSVVDTGETSASTTYAALATAGPSIVLPFAGDYDVHLGSYQRTNTINTSSLMSFDVGGTGAIDADSTTYDTDAVSNGAQVSTVRRKTGLTAVTLTAKYKVIGATTGRWANRFMAVVPVRVG